MLRIHSGHQNSGLAGCKTIKDEGSLQDIYNQTSGMKKNGESKYDTGSPYSTVLPKDVENGLRPHRKATAIYWDPCHQKKDGVCHTLRAHSLLGHIQAGQV